MELVELTGGVDIGLEFRLLGPTAAIIAGQEIDLGQPRQRALLAALLVDAGRVVRTEVLVERVWGASPPARARHAVQVYVCRIRRLPVEISQRSGGYLVDVDPDTVDVHRFRRLIHEAADGQPQRVDHLRQALALWRGQPLADVAGDWAESVRVAWHHQRVEAAVAWARSFRDRGDADMPIGTLSDLATEYPLIEPLAVALMQALQDSGRGAEALRHYAVVRARLADELGTDPGQELQDLHRTILNALPEPEPPAQTPTVYRPAQLPADVRQFTGRVDALKRLDDLLDTSHLEQAVVIVAVSGTAGVGKTALAVHWAHRVADRFHDGQLYLNLRGYGPPGEVVPADEAVGALLEGLGVPAQRIPVGLDTRAALYRSVVSGRRMLVLLDNARDAAQIRPLLPAAGCLVLVTSRSTLAGLVAAEGAVPLPLEVLGGADARRLLAGRLGAARIGSEPAAVAEIVERCAGLPLALAIAAARAATEPRRSLRDISSMLAEADSRLDPFSGADPMTDIRAVFAWSYRLLRPPAARLFRLLGLHPGDDVSVPVALSLTGTPPGQVTAALAELVDAQLLTETEPGRYAFHDLLRAFAEEQAGADPEAPSGLRRLLDHYLHTAASAARHLDPFRTTVPLPPLAPGVVPQPCTGEEQAMAWFTAEYRALLAGVRQAAESTDPGLALHPARLARSLEDFQRCTGRWSDALATHRTAVAAARQHRDQLGEALAQHGIARAQSHLGDADSAHDAGLAAATIFHRVGLYVAEADVHRSIANALARAGRLAESLPHARRQAELCAAHGDAAHQAQGLNTYGVTLAELGRPAEALDPLTRALDLQDSINDRWGAAYTLDSLGLAYLQLGRLQDADTHYRRSLDLFSQTADRYGMVYPLCGLGDVHAARHERDNARRMYQRAQALCQEVGVHHLAATVDERLRKL